MPSVYFHCCQWGSSIIISRFGLVAEITRWRWQLQCSVEILIPVNVGVIWYHLFAGRVDDTTAAPCLPECRRPGMMSIGDGGEYLLGERHCQWRQWRQWWRRFQFKCKNNGEMRGVSCGQTRLTKARIFVTQSRQKWEQGLSYKVCMILVALFQAKDIDFPVPFKRLQYRSSLHTTSHWTELKVNHWTGQVFTFQRAYFLMGTHMLVVQGVGIPIVCLFMHIRVILTVLDNIWWRTRHVNAMLSTQKYFPGNNNLLTVKTTIPYHLALLVFSKVTLDA